MTGHEALGQDRRHTVTGCSNISGHRSCCTPTCAEAMLYALIGGSWRTSNRTEITRARITYLQSERTNRHAEAEKGTRFNVGCVLVFHNPPRRGGGGGDSMPVVCLFLITPADECQKQLTLHLYQKFKHSEFHDLGFFEIWVKWLKTYPFN
jgi:hypothetical protein